MKLAEPADPRGPEILGQVGQDLQLVVALRGDPGDGIPFGLILHSEI